MTLSFIHDGVVRFGQRLFIYSYTANYVATYKLLTMLAFGFDGHGAQLVIYDWSNLAYEKIRCGCYVAY
jgi:hypothetical protein